MFIFFKTNTFLNNQTLLNEIYRIPYGCSLSFNKINQKISIDRYWNFSQQISSDSYEDILFDVNEKFKLAI